MPYIPVAVVEVNEVSEPPDAGPPPIAGYTAWYDGADSSQMTLTGQLVTQWNDKSANNFHAASPAGAPYLARDVTTGRTVVAFTNSRGGVTSGLSATSVDMSDVTFTAFVVAMLPTVDSPVNDAFTLIGPNDDGGNQLRVERTRELSTLRTDVDFKGTQSNATVTLGAPFVATQLLTATNVTHYLNTTSETDASATTFSGGRTLVIGRAPTAFESGQHGWTGWIGEVVIYHTTLSGANVDTTIAHLMDKWSIA